MKVVQVVHGYPPELVGGTEVTVQGVAHGLARRGVDVLCVAGSIDHQEGFRTSEAVDPVPKTDGGTVRVLRIHRDDLHFEHWQKSAAPRVAAAFRGILHEERPDLVHVHHWQRLSRDLVHSAALAGVPAVVTLHDAWTSCLIAFRVRPDTRAYCEAPLAPDPCLACAGGVAPRTPWVAPENLHMAFAERRADLVRELELAREVLVPSRAHAAACARFLSLGGDFTPRVVRPGRDLAATPVEPPPAPTGPGATGAPLVLGLWGHLTPVKGADLVLAAVRGLRDPGRVRLEIAGGEVDGAYASRLRELADGLDVGFHGPYETGASGRLEDHPAGRVHAVVSGSRALESWGLVADEALALRLPLVLPRAGAFAERFADGRGVRFYERGDPASLTAELQGLLDDPPAIVRLREELPTLAESVPSIAEHVEELLGVYAGAVEAGAPEVPEPDWWRERMQRAAQQAWDASLAAATAEELGFA